MFWCFPFRPNEKTCSKAKASFWIHFNPYQPTKSFWDLVPHMDMPSKMRISLQTSFNPSHKEYPQNTHTHMSVSILKVPHFVVSKGIKRRKTQCCGLFPPPKKKKKKHAHATCRPPLPIHLAGRQHLRVHELGFARP